MKKWICLAAALGLWSPFRAPAQEAPAPEAPALETTALETTALETTGFRVVVNAANEMASMERSRVSKMFLKQIRTWPGSDLSVALVDQSEKSPVRAAFTRAIHKKKVSAIKSYWFRRIFSGRDVPPEEVGSDRSVLEFVRGDPGAIGYVSSEAELEDGVKELEITE